MASYKKPMITSYNSTDGVFPLAAAAPFAAVVGVAKAVGLAKAVAVGAAALVGVAAGVKKGGNIINSMHTIALTARKDFSLA